MKEEDVLAVVESHAARKPVMPVTRKAKKKSGRR
jgi:hypothetical protein